MQETARHKAAFNFYYSLGEERSLVLVGLKFGVSKQSAEKWSSNFNWQERVIQRDLNNAKKLEERTDEKVVDRMAKDLADIEKLTDYFKAHIANAQQDIKDGKLKPVTSRDMKDAASGLAEMIKLKRLLLGESTDNAKSEIRIINEFVEPDNQGETE